MQIWHLCSASLRIFLNRWLSRSMHIYRRLQTGLTVRKTTFHESTFSTNLTALLLQIQCSITSMLFNLLFYFQFIYRQLVCIAIFRMFRIYHKQLEWYTSPISNIVFYPKQYVTKYILYIHQQYEMWISFMMYMCTYIIKIATMNLLLQSRAMNWCQVHVIYIDILYRYNELYCTPYFT